jgi:hypothetical protein
VKGYSEKLLNLRRETIGEENYRTGMDSLARDLDRERVARWVVAFLRQPA